MHTRILLIILVVVCFGCSQQDINHQQKQKPVYTKNKYSKLLSKYKDVTFDTLKVSSPEKEGWNYPRVELDSLDAILFPESISKRHFNDPPGLFALCKFPIDKNRIGLMTLTPSEYAPTSVKLFFYNKTLDNITSYIELAESFGDAGDYMTKDSWLFRDSNKRLNSFTWLLDGHANEVDNPNDTTVDETNYYYLIDLSKSKPDTIDEDQNKLKKRFSHILK